MLSLPSEACGRCTTFLLWGRFIRIRREGAAHCALLLCSHLLLNGAAVLHSCMQTYIAIIGYTCNGVSIFRINLGVLGKLLE